MAKLNYDVTIKRNEFVAYGKCQALIREFESSGKQIAEIVIADGEYKGIHSAQSAYMTSIKRIHSACRVWSRDGRLYIQRGDVK